MSQHVPACLCTVTLLLHPSSWLLLSTGPLLRRARAGPRGLTWPSFSSPTGGLSLWDQRSPLDTEDWKQQAKAEYSMYSDHRLGPYTLLPSLSHSQAGSGPHFLGATTMLENARWGQPFPHFALTAPKCLCPMLFCVAQWGLDLLPETLRRLAKMEARQAHRSPTAPPLPRGVLASPGFTCIQDSDEVRG